MKHREHISFSSSNKLARRTAKKTRQANIIKSVSRGGIRF